MATTTHPTQEGGLIMDIDKPDTEECRGKIYKYIINKYIDNNGNYTQKSTMRLLKRKSCKGCLRCDWLDEAIQEYLHASGNIYVEKPAHDSLYEIVVIDGDVDYETGCPDGFDLEFRRQTPPKKET